MKNSINIIVASILMLSIVSCKKDSKPNYQYMPNMYESLGYETYGEYKVFGNNGQEAKLPAEGSIARGWMPYDYKNSTEGYQLAKDSLKNPIRYTKANQEEGKALYDIYCAICHGTKGDGKGTLVKREKILGVPAYNDPGRILTEGSIYHVMYYGINSMGSYASQTSEHERWQIVQYVEKLKADLEGKTARIDSDVVIQEVSNLDENLSKEVTNEDHSNAHH